MTTIGLLIVGGHLIVSRRRFLRTRADKVELTHIGRAVSLSLACFSLSRTARAVEKLVEPVSFVLLAHNVPYYCSGNSIGKDGQGLSLRHEVCHRLLCRRFLCHTSYVGDVSDLTFLSVMLHCQKGPLV